MSATSERYEGRWHLPDHWNWVEIGEVAEIIGGSTPHNASDSSNYDENGLPWITPADLSGYKATYISKGTRSLSTKGEESCSVRVLPKGTVLFSSRAPVGYCVIASNPVATNQGFRSFVLQGDLVPEFARYYLLASKAYAESKASGTTFKELSGSAAKTIEFPLAPLKEQTRIVCKIDELFSRIEAGEKALQRAKILVERYRKSVLKAAVTGELTKDWRENNKDKIEPANKLMERILKSRREAWEKSELAKMKAKGKQPADDSWKKKYVEPAAPDTTELPDLPEGWVWATVDQLTSFITSGSRGWKEHYAESGAKFIRAQNINQEFLDETDIAFVNLPTDAEGLRTRVFQHDVLVTITGANVTKSALIEDDIGEAYVNQHVALLRPSLLELVKYLFLWLKAPEAGRTQLEAAAYGAGKPGLSLSNIKEVSVALPPLREMKVIVSLAGVLGEKIDDCLTSILQQDLSTTALLQSVLKSAFEGKLVAQDPSDEPASALLDRIRSATVSPKPSKSRKVK